MNQKLNKAQLLSAFLLLLAFGCKPAEEQKKPVEPSKEVAVSTPKEVVSNEPKIKSFSLTFSNLIENNRLNKLPVLTKNEIERFKVETALDENFANDYKYHLIDRVLDTPSHKMYLIAREYENENTVWLCLFDKNHKVLNAKEVYYDNAEGNYQVEAVLKKDTLTLFMSDVNDGKYTEVYSFDKEFKAVPVKGVRK
ncbi:hypothetical protein [Runella sp.]|jgi:hypothetical protein|uniref:hypothetical protein n=1 Tax=Runella sp. TaxID=1960881 RepID=UPI002632BE03|nr:hypothetical protein [Runella sp.]